MVEIADQYAGGRLISVLEGGYNLNALASSVSEHLSGLSGNTSVEALKIEPESSVE